LQTSSKDYIFIIVFHHIIIDPWSVFLLVRDITAFYDAFSHNRTHTLPEQNYQYMDYVLWERKKNNEEEFHKLISYWKEKLSGEIPRLKLPSMSLEHSLVSSEQGNVESLLLSQELTEKIKIIHTKENTTLFEFLLAVFKILLYRYTGEVDIAIGSPVANRDFKKWQSVLGLFINTLVYRTTISRKFSFLEFLRHVRNTCRQALLHKDLPFEKLVSELQPQRDLGVHPFFQILFVHRNFPSLYKSPISTMKFEKFEIGVGDTQFDLSLIVEEIGENILVSINYNNNLFQAEIIKNILVHYRTLLQDAIVNPNKLISEMKMLQDDDVKQLLSWNKTENVFKKEKCIHQLFENIVENQGDSIALAYKNKYLTYKALNQRANKLAHYLKTLGVAPESLVAINMQRSLELIVGLLAILKAGGTYVPLDLSYPIDRLQFMLQETKANVLLTQGTLLDLWKNYTGNIIAVDNDWDIIGQQSINNLINTTLPDNLMYIIYTSGSTGKPNGVACTHINVLNLLNLFWVYSPPLAA